MFKSLMIPGMSWGTHKWIFLSWMYTGVGLVGAYYFRSQEKSQQEEEFLNFIRHAGDYKHPWEVDGNDSAVSSIKGKDYTVSVPQGCLKSY